jgi:hypothetical protein
MTVIRGDPIQLFTDHIRYTPLRSVEGLLAAMKPLLILQIRQLHLLGLLLYCTACPVLPQVLTEDRDWLEEKLYLENSHLLVQAYHNPMYNL